LVLSLSFRLEGDVYHLYPHSFPTRRSSDLWCSVDDKGGQLRDRATNPSRTLWVIAVCLPGFLHIAATPAGSTNCVLRAVCQSHRRLSRLKSVSSVRWIPRESGG